MQTVSATEAKQKLASLLDTAQREPVMIRRHDRDIAVVLSPAEYQRLRSLHISEFERFSDRVSDEAARRGLNETILAELLTDVDPAT